NRICFTAQSNHDVRLHTQKKRASPTKVECRRALSSRYQRVVDERAESFGGYPEDAVREGNHGGIVAKPAMPVPSIKLVGRWDQSAILVTRNRNADDLHSVKQSAAGSTENRIRSRPNGVAVLLVNAAISTCDSPVLCSFILNQKNQVCLLTHLDERSAW